MTLGIKSTKLISVVSHREAAQRATGPFIDEMSIEGQTKQLLIEYRQSLQFTPEEVRDNLGVVIFVTPLAEGSLPHEPLIPPATTSQRLHESVLGAVPHIFPEKSAVTNLRNAEFDFRLYSDENHRGNIRAELQCRPASQMLDIFFDADFAVKTLRTLKHPLQAPG